MNEEKKMTADSLEYCVKTNRDCRHCPYDGAEVTDTVDCRDRLMLDAAALLKDPWIPADKYMPEVGERVLIVIPESQDYKRRIRIADCRWDGAFTVIGTAQVVKASHWQPMPDFPEE